MHVFFKGINKAFSQIQLMLLLRIAAIVIQFFLILFVNLGLNYQLPWLPLLLVITAEIVFTLGSFLFYHHKRSVEQTALLGQIIADIVFLSLLLYFSGGATNAFVSLLLIPIALAAVTLSSALLLFVALIAVASYSVLLWLLPMHVMHGNMQGHFIGMWMNFLFSTGVVALVVGKMARSINSKELAIAAFREEQLKQEKVISLGVAAAQITHQLATPIATVQLLADELKEDYPKHPAIDDLLTELARCGDSLSAFRCMVFDIKEQALKPEKCAEIIEKIVDNIRLNYPDIELDVFYKNNQALINSPDVSTAILSDAALLPAILNLVNNGVRATKDNNSDKIELTSNVSTGHWQLEIRDFGAGFTQSKLAELGVKPVTSEQGLGMAVLLSHASLERLGGKLSLTNHDELGAKVTLTLPIVEDLTQGLINE